MLLLSYLSLRRQLWEQVFQLYDDSRFQDRILSAIYTYSTDGYRINTKEIIEVDAASVLPFLSENLEPERYIHCVIAHKFLDLLERHQISFDLDLREHFSSETYTLSRLFLHDTFSRREFELDFHEFEAYKRERIRAHFEPFNFDNFKWFFEQALEIQGNLAGINPHQLMTGVENVFEDLAERDSELFAAVLGHYLQLGDPLRLNWISRVVLRLIHNLGAEDALALLKKFDYPTKRRWLFSFYMGLTPEQINERRLEELYALYREAEAQDMFDRLDYLLKYREVDKRVIPKVVEIISAKIELGSASASALMQVVNNHLGTDESLVSIFEDDIGILKRAYLSVCKARQHDDYKSVVFSRILDVAPNFILEYIDKMYEGETYISWHNNQRSFSFLWLRDDYERLMTEVVEHTYSRERTRFAFDTYLQSFFILETENKDRDAIRERQDRLLGGLIERRYADIDFMSYLFHMIRDFSDERRRTFLALFLQHNSSFEDFKRLPLGPNHWNSLGSLVPTLQSHVDSLRSLLPLLNTVQFLEHRQRVEQDIQRFYRWIEKEKREDFMED